jgi:hypothetical protein
MDIDNPLNRIWRNITPKYAPTLQGDILHSRLANQKAIEQLQWLHFADR